MRISGVDSMRENMSSSGHGRRCTRASAHAIRNGSWLVLTESTKSISKAIGLRATADLSASPRRTHALASAFNVTAVAVKGESAGCKSSPPTER